MNTPMKLLIFEENHFEVLNVYIDIFGLLKEKVELHLVTSHDVYAWTDKAKLPNNIIFTNDFKKRDDLQNAIVRYVQEKQISIFVYNTILVGDYQFAGQLLQLIKSKTGCKTVLTLHNINALFQPSIFHKNILVAYKYLQNYWYKFRYVHPNVDAYNVLCTNQLLFLKSIQKTQKPVLYIPPCIVEENETLVVAKERKPLTIAIPGGVDQNRRDYEFVLQALKVDKQIFPQLRIMILGPFKGDYGKMVLNELKQMKSEGLNIWIAADTDENISGDLFVQRAAEADIFLCPLKEETSYEGKKEYYGKSKSSGSFYDIVRYKKAAIFPSNISLPKEIKTCTLSYSDAKNLSDTFKLLINDPSALNSLNKEVNQLSRYFGAEKISKEVYQKLEALL